MHVGRVAEHVQAMSAVVSYHGQEHVLGDRVLACLLPALLDLLATLPLARCRPASPPPSAHLTPSHFDSDLPLLLALRSRHPLLISFTFPGCQGCRSPVRTRVPLSSLRTLRSQ